MPYFYCVHTRYKDDSVVYKDTILTANSTKEAGEYARDHLSGSSYDDGSLYPSS